MGSGEQELKLRAKLEGGEETAKGLDKIAGAEKRVIVNGETDRTRRKKG